MVLELVGFRFFSSLFYRKIEKYCMNDEWDPWFKGEKPQ